MIGHLLQPLVCERFKNDARYREGHLRVVNALPARLVLGLHSPEMKLVAKQLSREGCEVVMPEMKMLAKQLSRGGGEAVMPDGVCSCRNGAEMIKCFEKVPSAILSHEEMMIWGFLINLEKCDDESRFAMLSRFVPVMD